MLLAGQVEGYGDFGEEVLDLGLEATSCGDERNSPEIMRLSKPSVVYDFLLA